MSSTNTHTETLSGTESVTGVDTDGSGQFEVTFGELRHIESVADVSASATGGYVINPVSVSGNTVTFEVRTSSGTGGNEMTTVTGTNGVTDVHARAEGY